MSRDKEIGVHQGHCCVTHGCKYGDDDCPVVNKIVVQDFPCEDCSYDGINAVDEIPVQYEGTVIVGNENNPMSDMYVDVTNETENLSEILESKFRNQKVRITIQKL